MIPLPLVLLLQETLPPPPSPTTSPSIDTTQVVGVVIISLSLITLAALLLRPFVARLGKSPASQEAKPEAEEAPAAPTPEVTPPASKTETQAASIIPFPRAVTPAEQPWAWPEVDPAVESRLKRVIADSGRRRKLGDRQPNVAEAVQMARLRAVIEEHPVQQRNTPLILPPIVPLRDRRNLASAGPVVSAEPIAQSQTATMLLEPPVAIEADPTEVVENVIEVAAEPEMQPTEPVAVGHITEPFQIIRTEPAAAEEPVHEDWELVVEELTAAQLESRDELIDSTWNLARSEVDVIIDAETGGDAPSETDVHLVTLAESLDERREREGNGVIDERTLAGISQTVRDLIYCANAGKLLNGFSLYSDPYLFRFMDSTGLDEEGFRDRFTSIAPRPPEEWERLDRLSDIQVLDDGRIVATVSYVDNVGRPTNGAERFRFDYSVESKYWMIDDIQVVD